MFVTRINRFKRLVMLFNNTQRALRNVVLWCWFWQLIIIHCRCWRAIPSSATFYIVWCDNTRCIAAGCFLPGWNLFNACRSHIQPGTSRSSRGDLPSFLGICLLSAYVNTRRRKLIWGSPRVVVTRKQRFRQHKKPDPVLRRPHCAMCEWTSTKAWIITIFLSTKFTGAASRAG